MTTKEFLQLAKLLSKLAATEHFSHAKRNLIQEIVALCITCAETMLHVDVNDIPF